jgi:hypothetical protein
MAINLLAVNDFTRGDVGRVAGHRVSRVEHINPEDRAAVTALQDIKAGMHGWFDDTPKSK